MVATIKSILKKLEVNQDNSVAENSVWVNRDLAPITEERRTWRAWNFVALWISDCLNVNTFMIAGSFIALGCNWWQALIIVGIGYTLCAMILVVNGRCGADYHIGFPVMARSSFGLLGSFVPVVNRIFLGVVWYGVQAFIGGQCVYQMLKAIAPSVEYIPNTFSPDAGVTVKAFLGFFLFSLLSLIAIWFPVEKIRHLFTIKSFLVPIAAIALFVWAIVNAHGLGPIVQQPATFKSTGEATWVVIASITSCFGNMAALIVNTNDFTRFSTNPKDIVWSQLITMPLGFFLTSFVGIVVTSASQHLYGEALWNPIDLLDRMENRPAVFFLALAFAYATLGTNLVANSIPVGADLTALCPKYINQRRGGYICAMIGFCITPWHLLSGAATFLNLISGFTVFLGPITGVLVVDYYIIKKKHLLVEDLYDPKGIYWYTYGINWRAYAAYIGGIIPNLPGFIGSFSGNTPSGADYIYNLAWIVGFAVGGIIYYTTNRLFPCHWIIADQQKEVIVDSSYDGEQKKNPSLTNNSVNNNNNADNRSVREVLDDDRSIV